MNYISTLLGTAAILIAFTVALNWKIDPAGLFRKTSFGQQYVKALVSSENGLVSPDSIDDREIKSELAKLASLHDCVVIGSSHVMQVGSARKHRSFPSCKSILNLGVSGAGFEDHVVLTWLALSSGKPRVLILGIDPWTFAFGKDGRWKVRYAEQYLKARMAIDGKDSTVSESTDRWLSLISAQYTKRSLGHLLRGATTLSIVAAPRVDEDVGHISAILLPDGSHLYSADNIKSAKIARVPAGGDTYKTDGLINNLAAVDFYRRLILWAKSEGVTPVFLMTPYHQNVWSLYDSPNVKAMVPTEKIVRNMGSELNVPVIGSFRPDIAGCFPEEFYDFMHPTASCVARFSARANFENLRGESLDCWLNCYHNTQP